MLNRLPMILIALILPPTGRCLVAAPPLTCVRVCPGGEQLVACSQAGISLFSCPDLNLISTYPVQSPNLHDLSFSPRGDRLAVAGGTPGENGTVEIFSWPALESLQVMDGHLDSVMAVSWMNDQSLASAGLDHFIVVWQTSTGEPLMKLKGHSHGVCAIDYLPDQNVLVSGGIDQSIRVWNAGTGQLQRSLSIHSDSIACVTRRPNTLVDPTESRLPMIASASDDRTVRFWQPTIGRMVRFAKLPAPPRDLQWSPDGTNVVACCDDGHVYFIDPETVQITPAADRIDGWAYAVAVLPNDAGIAVGGAGGTLLRVALKP